MILPNRGDFGKLLFLEFSKRSNFEIILLGYLDMFMWELGPSFMHDPGVDLHDIDISFSFSLVRRLVIKLQDNVLFEEHFVGELGTRRKNNKPRTTKYYVPLDYEYIPGGSYILNESANKTFDDKAKEVARQPLNW